MRTLTKYHNKHVLVSGQGPTEEIARMYVINLFLYFIRFTFFLSSLGFKSITSVENVCKAFPELDMVNHNHRVKLVC